MHVVRCIWIPFYAHTLSPSLSHTHTHKHTRTQTHTRTHTFFFLSLSHTHGAIRTHTHRMTLSLSLSLTHTHTHAWRRAQPAAKAILHILHRYVGNLKFLPIPPKKLFRCGVSTPVPPVCLMCTTNSNLKCMSILYHNEWAVVDIRWFPVDGVRHPLDSRKLFVRSIHTHEKFLQPTCRNDVIRTHTHTWTHTFSLWHTHTHTHTLWHTHTHTHTLWHMHTHKLTHAHTHRHTHSLSLSFSLSLSLAHMVSRTQPDNNTVRHQKKI